MLVKSSGHDRGVPTVSIESLVLRDQAFPLELVRLLNERNGLISAIVKDFAPFREFIRSTLEERANLQIICEVADGLEAVRKAKELKPDLVRRRHRTPKD